MSASLKQGLVAVCASVLAMALNAEEFVVTVNAGDADVTWSAVSDAGPAALLAGGVNDRQLVKKGGGRLIIACDLQGAGYAGEISVQEGFLRLRHDGACGTSAGGVTVVSGATLEGDPTYKSGGSLKYSNEPLTFEGFGVGGVEGAVKMLGGSPSTWNFFTSGKKTMTGDALWVGLTRLDVRSGEFDMGGHTLYASNSVAIVQSNVTNPGRIVYLGGGTISMESSVKLNGGATNELVMLGGSFNTVSFTEEQKWTLAISNTVSILPRVEHAASRTNLASAVTRNRWNGPIHIADGAKLQATLSWINPATIYGPDPYHHLITLNGRVSGGGEMSLEENAYIRLGCPTNDFAGGVKLRRRALLEAAGVGALGPGGLKSIGDLAAVYFMYDELYPMAMTDGEYERILRFKSDLRSGKNYYDSMTNVLFTGLSDYSLSSAVPSDISLVCHDETNTLTLANGVSGVPNVVNTAGTLVLGGAGDFSLGEIRVRDGTVRLADGARYHLGENVFYVHGTYPMTPKLVVGANAVLSSRDDASSTKLPVNYLAGGLGGDSRRDFVRGILELSAGATMSNVVIVGGAKVNFNNPPVTTNSMGALYMRGGTLVQQGSNSRDEFVIGHSANGYFEMADGFLDASKRSIWILVGSKSNGYGMPGYGVMHVKGGRVEHRSMGFGVNDGGGYGHFRVSGGVVSNDTFIVGKSLWTGRYGGEGVATVDGSGEIVVAGNAQLGGISNSVSIVNMNGGVFSPYSLQVLTNLCQTSGSASQFCEFLEGADNPVYVNFGGGTYKPNIGDSWRGWIDARVRRYTVFAGGACVDVGRYGRQLHVPFKAPSGNGVKAIPFACNEPWRYIGSPYVRIVDPTGAGYGASAFADFDSTNGVVTGVTVTSPGCDYGEGTYAEIAFGGWTNTVRIVAIVEPNDLSGGFTKLGSGALEIPLTNDWHGVTRVKEGQLNLVVPHALPNSAGFDIAENATVWFGDKPQYGGTLEGTGRLSGNYVLSGTLTVDANDLLAGRRITVAGNLAIEPGTRLVVRNAELLPRLFRSASVVHVENGTLTGTLAIDQSVFQHAVSLDRRGQDLYFGPLRGMSFSFR